MPIERERWLAIILRTGLLVLFLWMIQDLLVPVVLGALFALLFSPLQERLGPRLGKAQGFAPLLITVSSLVLIVIPFVFIAIEVVQSITDFLARDWTYTFTRLQAFLTDGVDIFGRRIHIGGPQLQSVVTTAGQRTATFLAGFVGGLATTVPTFIISLFLFVVALYYFLRDGGSLTAWLLRFSPFAPGQTRELFISVRETVNGAILGLVATALVQGSLTTIGLYIFRVPNAFLLGVFATVMSFVPLIGTTPVTVGSAIYLFAIGRVGAGFGMLATAVIVGLSDNVVRPWVQSSRTRMHPLMTLLGIFGGISLFGAAGIFIGPIIAAMAIWAVDTYARLHPPVRRDSTPPTEPHPTATPPPANPHTPHPSTHR
ncbi:MAG TPA: AI-2E family transporter, partial [Thermoanaerobaculia bacterium]|nr:AI-2E family transporter [Thermoanaerobaculia bacterium]